MKKLLLIILLLSLTGCTLRYKTENPHYIEIPQGKIEYYKVGTGTPIILVPGYAMDVTNWSAHFITALAQHHQVIIFNLRNVGGSQVNSENYQAKDLARDIHYLIHQLHLYQPTLVGISMGGMVAQEVAVLYPRDIHRLVLINTVIAGSQAIHPDKATEKLMQTMPANQLGKFRIAVKLFFPKQAQLSMGVLLITDRFKPRHYTEINPTKVVPKQRKLVLNWISNNKTAQKISTLFIPVLILNGEADQVLPPANSLILANQIPNAQLIRFKQGGHAMIYQYPEKIAAIIHNFCIP